MSKLKLGFELDTKEFENVGLRAFLTTMSGGGKSHAAKVLVEEMFTAGYPIVIIDPEGEYAAFRALYSTLIVGGSFADIPLTESLIKKTIEMVLTNQDPLIVVYDLNTLLESERQRFSAIIQKELFVAASKYRRAMLFVVEECQLVAPQALSKGRSTESLDIAIDIAKRGRKRGINSIWITHRAAAVSKDVISQCNYWFIGKMIMQNDLDALKGYFKQAKIDVVELMKLTHQFFMHDGTNTTKVKFRNKQVKDLASTPKVGEIIQLERTKDRSLNNIINQLVKQAEVETEQQEKREDRLKKLEKRNMQLQDKIDEQQEEIKSLEKDNSLLSKIQVVSGGNINEQELDKILVEKRQIENELKSVTKNFSILEKRYDSLAADTEEVSKYKSVIEKLKQQFAKVNELLNIEVLSETMVKIEELDQEVIIDSTIDNKMKRVSFLKHPTIKKIIDSIVADGSSKPVVKGILGMLIKQDESTYEEIRKAKGYADKTGISKVASKLVDREIVTREKNPNGGYVLRLNIEALEKIINLQKTLEAGEATISELLD